MRNSRTLPVNEETQTIKRLQNLSEPEIRTYVSSLKRNYGKYRQPLNAARKIIDDAMKKASLTDVLYRSRLDA